MNKTVSGVIGSSTAENCTQKKNNSNKSQTVESKTLDSAKPGAKPHYQILDGLRGVAAIIVVFFHLAEPLAKNRFENVINHGYLAVDFFFLLSGYVIGYAYDDRWNKLTIAGFLRRRLERVVCW